MAKRDKTRVQILALIEKHGPLSADAIREHMNNSISRSALHTSCMTAIGAGYLSMTMQFNGRKHAVFSRTDKPYPVERTPTERALERARQKREAAERRRERQELKRMEEERKARLNDFTPFRHPLDEIFFGPWTKPIQVSPIKPRFIEKW